LEVQVNIEVHVAISFGLEVFASLFGLIAGFMEVFMKNSFAIVAQVMACVWCGIAFLRSSGEKKIPIQARDHVRGDIYSAKRERRGFDSLSPHQFVRRSMGCANRPPHPAAFGAG